MKEKHINRYIYIYIERGIYRESYRERYIYIKRER